MTQSSYHDITLQLSNIKHLFKEPEFDPFICEDNVSSGIDQIISEIKPQSLKPKVRTTILLPANQISENLEQSVTQAVQRYCRAKIEQITSDLSLLRGRGIRALQRGLVFLAVCLLLSTLFDGLESVPGLLRRLLSEGFLIAGWVSLWYPIELLLYEWGPYWREKQIYRRIEQMELEILPKQSTAEILSLQATSCED
jgi:hypothetical protein